jgi:hypothetical protein
MDYYILDNGDKPFHVYINGLNVYIYNRFKLQYKFVAEKIFIGTSPINKQTLYSGHYGPEFDGNSILLKIFKNKYVFIGSRIYSFTSYSKIVDFRSPVGNSMVPYPYAIDTFNNYYLFLEKIVLGTVPKKYLMDPYDYYYKADLITTDHGFKNPKRPLLPNFKGITNFYLGPDRYTLRFAPDAKKNYQRLASEIGPLTIEKRGKKYPLSQNEYITLMNEFANEMDFKRLKAIHTIFEN